MKLNLSRTNAAVTLFVAAIFFIVANIAADYLLKREDKPLPQLSADQINLNFLSSLKNLGIKESWVKSKTANRNKKNDSLKYNYKVEIPADLPIAVVLSEINEMFDEGNEKQNWDKLENLVKKQNAKHKFWKEPKY